MGTSQYRYGFGIAAHFPILTTPSYDPHACEHCLHTSAGQTQDQADARRQGNRDGMANAREGER